MASMGHPWDFHPPTLRHKASAAVAKLTRIAYRKIVDHWTPVSEMPSPIYSISHSNSHLLGPTNNLLAASNPPFKVIVLLETKLHKLVAESGRGVTGSPRSYDGWKRCRKIMQNTSDIIELYINISDIDVHGASSSGPGNRGIARQASSQSRWCLAGSSDPVPASSGPRTMARNASHLSMAGGSERRPTNETAKMQQCVWALANTMLLTTPDNPSAALNSPTGHRFGALTYLDWLGFSSSVTRTGLKPKLQSRGCVLSDRCHLGIDYSPRLSALARGCLQ